MLHNLKHNKVLHEQVVLRTEEILFLVDAQDRVSLEKLEESFWRLQIHFDLVERPDVPCTLESVKEPGLRFNSVHTTYFIGRETILATRNSASPRGAARSSPG